MSKMPQTCKNCQRMYFDRHACATRKAMFCSRKCAAARLIKWKECKQCGATFQRFIGGKNGGKQYCSQECSQKGRIGSKMSEASKIAMSKARIGKWMGEDSPSWKGGITPVNQKIRTSRRYKLWRSKVFKRDKYLCRDCKIPGKILNADHIKRFADYPKLRFNINNGRTLCVDCHKKTPTYGNKKQLV